MRKARQTGSRAHPLVAGPCRKGLGQLSSKARLLLISPAGEQRPILAQSLCEKLWPLHHFLKETLDLGNQVSRKDDIPPVPTFMHLLEGKNLPDGLPAVILASAVDAQGRYDLDPLKSHGGSRLRGLHLLPFASPGARHKSRDDRSIEIVGPDNVTEDPGHGPRLVRRPTTVHGDHAREGPRTLR